MFHIFFAVNYWITKYIFRNKEYPIFSTIVVVTAYQFFTLLFLYNFIFYQIYHRQDLIKDKSNIIGYAIMTIIILLNFYYFKSKKVKKILDEFNNLDKKSKLVYKILSITYMVLVIVLNIIMVNSTRNHTYWF